MDIYKIVCTNIENASAYSIANRGTNNGRS